MSNFADPLELREPAIQLRVVRRYRQVKQTRAQSPRFKVPFDGRAVSVSPRIRCVVKSTSVDQGPVHEVAARIVGFIHIKDIRHTELTDGDDWSVCRLRSCEFVEVSFDLFRISTQINCLPQEETRYPRIRHGGTNLISLTAWESGYAERAAQTEALINLRIDPQLGALPQPKTSVEGDIPSLAAVVGIEAIWAAIGRTKWKCVLR